MERRKVSSLNTLSVFKTYYKVLGKYYPEKSFPLSKVIKIRNPLIEKQIELFLEQYKYSAFSDRLSELEDYTDFCIRKKYAIYFHNYDVWIEEWKKERLHTTKDELKYLCSEKIQRYLRDNSITFKEYIEKKKFYIPIILQHYLVTKELPFELILFLKIIEKCDINKKKLKVMLYREFMELHIYEKRLEKLKELFMGEIKKILEHEEGGK